MAVRDVRRRRAANLLVACVCVCALHRTAGLVLSSHHPPFLLPARANLRGCGQAGGVTMTAAGGMERLRVVQLNVKRFTDQHGLSTAEVCLQLTISSHM